MHWRKFAHKRQSDYLLTTLRRSARLQVMAEPDLVSTQEASRILRRSPATVNRYAADDKLPVAKKIDGIRGARFYWRADVEALRDELDARFDEPAEAAS